MLPSERCLVVVADGARARLFEERTRGGALREITDRLGDLRVEGPRPSRHSGRVHDRFGPASHTTGGPAPKIREEAAFVTRLGQRVERIVSEDGYDDLVLIAAPRALGGLRAALSPGLAKRVSASEPAERVDEPPDRIRAALRQARLGTA